MERYAKALVGALVTVVGALGAAWADGSITPTEILIAAGAGLTALSAVWGVPNSPPK